MLKESVSRMFVLVERNETKFAQGHKEVEMNVRGGAWTGREGIERKEVTGRSW